MFVLFGNDNWACVVIFTIFLVHIIVSRKSRFNISNEIMEKFQKIVFSSERVIRCGRNRVRPVQDRTLRVSFQLFWPYFQPFVRYSRKTDSGTYYCYLVGRASFFNVWRRRLLLICWSCCEFVFTFSFYSFIILFVFLPTAFELSLSGVSFFT
jgi:hypothetical protein